MANQPNFNLSAEDIERLQRGDSRLQSKVFDKQALSYHRLAKNKWRISDEDAEEIVSEAFAKFFCRIQEADFKVDNCSGFVYVTLERLAWKVLERQNKNAAIGTDVFSIAKQNDNPFLESLNTALNLLGKKCQQLINDFYFDDKPHKEIAAELSISEEASRQRLRECMKKLKVLVIEKRDNPRMA